jgi:hypothetical protein
VQVTCRILLVININSPASDCRLITCVLEHRTTVNVFAVDQEVFYLLRSFWVRSGVHSAFYSMRTGGGEGGGVDSANVLRTEPKFDYPLVCNAEFERSVATDANIFQHARSYLKIQGSRRVT